MQERDKQQQSADPLVDVTACEVVYQHPFLTVQQATLRYRHSNGKLGDPVQWLAVNHGKAVGVLIYDAEADTVTLIRQFRYPVYAGLPEAERAGSGAQHAWLLEIVAGIQGEGQTAEETARRELREELGYEVAGDLHQFATVYTSPGYSTEPVTLFLAYANANAQQGGGGGLAEEGEDTQVVVLPFTEVLQMVERGEICDAKTILALQHLALRKNLASKEFQS